MRASQLYGPPVAVARVEVLGEEFADGGFVGEDCGRIDVGGGEVRVAGEDELGVLEGAGGVPAVARDDRDFDEGVDGVGQIFDGANDAESFKVRGELGPGGESVFAGEHELRVGEGDGGELVVGERICEAGWWRRMRSRAAGRRSAQSRASSLACFLYCSRLGRSGISGQTSYEAPFIVRKSGGASGVRMW